MIDDVDMAELLTMVLKTLKLKGSDYQAGSADRLHNFRRVSKLVDVPIKKVWLTYIAKHAEAVLKHVNTGAVASEPIEERILDCVCYLFLYYKLVKELEREQPVLPAAPDDDISF